MTMRGVVLTGKDGMKNRQSEEMEYTAFLELNERGGYTVTVPALPGLVTEGKGLEHARIMVKDAVRVYIEGLRKGKEPIPLERDSARVKISILAQADPKNPALQFYRTIRISEIKQWIHPFRYAIVSNIENGGSL
jgi:antitoxin HicB